MVQVLASRHYTSIDFIFIVIALYKELLEPLIFLHSALTLRSFDTMTDTQEKSILTKTV